jgi:hypothetical protein
MKRNGYTAIVLVLLLAVSVPAISTAVTSAQEQPEASFEVSDLSAPENVSQGDQVEVEATVTNNGSEQGQQTVEYRFDGDTERSKPVNLDGGESETVEFKLNTQNLDTGTYTHGVFVDGDNATAEIEIEEDDDGPGQGPPAGEFEVSDLSAPDNVSQGEMVDVEATVTNNGSEQGQQTVEYRFDGEVEKAKPVNLEGGENETVEFKLNTKKVDAGTYTHGVFVDGDNVTAEIQINESDGPGQGPPDDLAAFKNTSALTAQQTEPNSLAGKIRVESDLLENTSVELVTSSATEYTLNITVTEEAENVTFFLQSQAIESSQDIENVTAYLDGEKMDFYVDESAGPGNSPWILFEVDHFSTRTVTFASETSAPSGPVVTGEDPAQDIDGDDLSEDVTGDGVFTIADVSALLDNRNSDAVQTNVDLFDFNDDGAVTLADVQALFLQLAQN